MARLRVYLDGIQQGPGDGRTVRLKAFLDGEYLQFFTTTVTWLDQFKAQDREGVTEDAFWASVIDLALDQLRYAVESGQVPIDANDATKIRAFELSVTATLAADQATRSEATIPEHGSVVLDVEIEMPSTSSDAVGPYREKR